MVKKKVEESGGKTRRKKISGEKWGKLCQIKICQETVRKLYEHKMSAKKTAENSTALFVVSILFLINYCFLILPVCI
jgi:hypothetical protein